MNSLSITSIVGAAATAMAIGFSTCAIAGEAEAESATPISDASKSHVDVQASDVLTASPIRIAQRNAAQSGPIVDFDVADIEEPAEIENILGDKHSRDELKSLRPLFSSAFTSALKNIEQENASQRPTPALGDGKTPLSTLFSAVEEDAVRSAKPSLDLATEVTSTKPVEQKTPSALKLVAPEVIAPSVAGPKVAPIAEELEEFFKNVDKRPVPESVTVSKPQASAAPRIKDPSPPQAAIEEPQQSPPSQVQPAPQKKIRPREPNVRITQRMAALQPKVAKTLRFYFARPLNTRDDSAWSVMHSMLGYGPNGQVAINSERGQRTNVVNWMCQNGVCANRRLLYIQDGYIKGLEGPGFQGHPGQFLAMLAQIGTRRDYPMNIQGQRLDVDALVNSEMYTCSSEKELTFKLISLSYYLDSKATWKSESGETWTLPKILSMEMSQPVNGAACGGTHRIMSISCAIRNRWLRGESLDGPYAQAERYVRQYQQYALSLQNRDGSFSSEWFKRPAVSKDKDRQLQTSGHILEWLVYTLPRNELSDPRIVRGVEFLTNLMSRHRFRDWEVGPRGHAIRALSLYHQRVFERQPATPRMANAALWSAVLR